MNSFQPMKERKIKLRSEWQSKCRAHVLVSSRSHRVMLGTKIDNGTHKTPKPNWKKQISINFSTYGRLYFQHFVNVIKLDYWFWVHIFRAYFNAVLQQHSFFLPSFDSIAIAPPKLWLFLYCARFFSFFCLTNKKPTSNEEILYPKLFFFVLEYIFWFDIMTSTRFYLIKS